MKKQIFLRGVIGALGGMLIGQVVMIIISLCAGGSELMPVPPALAEQVGNELTAYILQSLAVMVYGAVWAAASVVWELDWSLTRQTVVHGLCYALSALPAAYLMHWFEHSWVGFLCYFGGFAVLYAAMWLSQYLGMRRRVRAMNERLQKL